MDLRRLDEWYALNQRQLPWRRSDPDPYHVWISEVMSQQSVLETVRKYFVSWMRAFPTLSDLASADEDSVMREWAGLGYYSRARLVLKTARLLQERVSRGEGWPSTAEQFLDYPGVGPYTAKAIAAIAFAEPVLPMDGNLIRVLARFYGISDPLNNPQDLTLIKARTAELENLLRGDASLVPGHLAQAFMDLGATLCRPRASARCEVCPLREDGCRAYDEGRVSAIPAAKLRKQVVYLDFVASPRINPQGEVWVVPIDNSSPGNLIGQWEIPLQKIKEGSPFWAQKSQVRHSITNHQFRVRVAPANPEEADFSAKSSGARGRWVNPQNPELHLSTLARKILGHFFA